MPNTAPLITFFRNFNENTFEFRHFRLKDWELLIRQARSSNSMSRVAFLLAERGYLEEVPESAKLHLQSALRVSEANARSVRWEVRQLHKALPNAGISFMLLKGAAYTLSGCAAAKGRVFADVDIMVFKERLDDAETELARNGWVMFGVADYDEKYYRKWMHELPPMRHLKRQTTLDVHHTIVPPTAIVRIDVKKLWENALPLQNYEGVFVLSLEDMILHSAAHLFYDGELEHGFRDITDLSLLFDQFASEGGGEASWRKLISRAEELDLVVPLMYATRYCAKILATKIPLLVIEELAAVHSGPKQRVMDALFIRALQPDHVSCNDRWTGLARWLLYIRSHWLRMPWYLLLPHLSRKAWMRLTGKEQP